MTLGEQHLAFLAPTEGGHVRTGSEYYMYYGSGDRAKRNAHLVKRVVGPAAKLRWLLGTPNIARAVPGCAAVPEAVAGTAQTS